MQHTLLSGIVYLSVFLTPVILYMLINIGVIKN